MRVVSLKLLVLMASSTAPSSIFTASDLVDETLSTWSEWFEDLDEARVSRSIRSCVSSMVRSGVLVQVGEAEKESGRRGGRAPGVFVFTDDGRKVRREASTKLRKVLSEMDRIVVADLSEPLVLVSTQKKKRKAPTELRLVG